MNRIGKYYVYYVMVLKEYMTRIIGSHYPTEIINLIILSVYEPIKISCGMDYTILHYDKIYTCGNNKGGRLGVGHEERVTSIPEEIVFPERIKSVHCGAEHRVALTFNPKKLYVWGKNNYDQLGFRWLGKIMSPHELHFRKPIVTVSCGYHHTIALTNISRILYVWGCNQKGQLGLGHTKKNASPQELILDEKIVSVSCGGYHSVALTCFPCMLYVWGLNYSGQLGLGNRTSYDSPRGLLLDEPTVSVSCGESHTMALIDTGELYYWGCNGNFQLGTESFGNYSPTKLSLCEPIKSIGCGGSFTIALTLSGKLYGWGANERGQLGIWERCNIRKPRELNLSVPIESVECGIYNVFALTKKGDIWVWGGNKNYELCLGYNKHQDTPTKLKF